MAEGQQKVFFNRVALIGLGLIGSSLARAIKRHGLAGEIVGHARSKETRELALGLGFIDRAAVTAAAAVKGADLVVIAVPVGVTGAIAQEIAPALDAGAIVTDVGSVKGAVVDAVGPHIPDGVHFVPAHPVAGTEESGPEAGFAELFEGRWCIITPPPGTDEEAVTRVCSLWRAVGSEVDRMDPHHHDMVLAITSHLPHLIAYTIVGTATDLENHLQREVIKFAAGGFRDFTRIAASDPVMWRDVFLANKDAVLEMLGRFDADLTALQRAIRYGDGAALEEIFKRTRAIRRSIVEAGQA
ncbi:MAG: prephenate/arogenate dehydrogenase family protein [Alphaproteobacteria bacterium]|nr:prephenate/arogenate dehydrogenase family protein [Alphaproteobacteria bacterium]MCZ6849787.1 prephenate/arogenate dehydrogenase family protein [Alphaproteobacteria bacterium]